MQPLIRGAFRALFLAGSILFLAAFRTEEYGAFAWCVRLRFQRGGRCSPRPRDPRRYVREAVMRDRGGRPNFWCLWDDVLVSVLLLSYLGDRGLRVFKLTTRLSPTRSGAMAPAHGTVNATIGVLHALRQGEGTWGATDSACQGTENYFTPASFATRVFVLACQKRQSGRISPSFAL